MSDQSTIFVVDEDPIHREGLSARLSSMGFATKLYPSAPEYWQSFDPNVPGCLIIDVNASVEGKPLQELLAQVPLSPPVVMISACMEVMQVVRAMRGGVVDFLQKRAYSELDLWEALQRALALDVVKRDEHLKRCEMQSKLLSLTEPERQVLRRLLLGNNNREVAAHYGISRAAVEARRIRMMKKLGVTTLVGLVTYAITAKFEEIDARD